MSLKCVVTYASVNGLLTILVDKVKVIIHIFGLEHPIGRDFSFARSDIRGI